MGPQRVSRRVRILVIAVAVVSMLASPILAVYELFLGLILVIMSVAQPGKGKSAMLIGLSVLAGPAAYTMAWVSVRLFD
jgi:hypothetical protein